MTIITTFFIVLKYHDIRYYHDNAFWLVFVYFYANFYETKHLNELYQVLKFS